MSSIIEKIDKGNRVMVKAKPQNKETIPLAMLRAYVKKAAHHWLLTASVASRKYVDKVF